MASRPDRRVDEGAPAPPRDTRPKPPHPFGPALDDGEAREFFRRLGARPVAEQEAFVGRVNWNLIDPGVESRLMAWLAGLLLLPDADRQRFALRTLDKLPHPKRGRHTSLFAELLPALDEDLRARLAAAFGPVLGGPRKPSSRPAKPAPPPAPPKAASSDDLAKLRDFFGKSGGAR
jgi:hypothetical protein